MAWNLFCYTCKIDPAAFFTFKAAIKIPFCAVHADEVRRSGTVLIPMSDFGLVDSPEDIEVPSLRRREVQSRMDVLCDWRRKLQDEASRQISLIKDRRTAYTQAIDRVCAEAETEVRKRHTDLEAKLACIEQDLSAFATQKNHEVATTTRLLDATTSLGLPPLVWTAELQLVGSLAPVLFGLFSPEGNLKHAIDWRKLRVQEACTRVETMLRAGLLGHSLATLVEAAEILLLAHSFVPNDSEQSGFAEALSKVQTTSKEVICSMTEIAHVEELRTLLQLMGNSVLRTVEKVAEFAYCFGQSLFTRKELPQAKQLLMDLRRVQLVLSPESLPLSNTSHLLGLVLKANRDKRTAIPFLEEAVSLRSRLPGVSQLDQADSLVNLGRCRKSIGEIDHAIACYQSAKRLLKAAAPGSARLAKLYYYISPLSQAISAKEAKCKKAIDIQERIAPGSLQLADSLSRLAEIYREVSRFAEAEAAISRAISILTAQNTACADLSRALNSLGYIFYEQGRYQQAIDQLNLAIMNQLRVGDSKDSALSCHLLGLAYLSQGNRPRARDYLVQAQEHYRKAKNCRTAKEIEEFMAAKGLQR